MVDCPACTAAATDPWHGIAYDGCAQCQARRLSLAPQRQRQAAYAAASDEARPGLIERVQAEYRRRMELLRGVAAERTVYVKTGAKG